jgi:hypothetical protein
MEFKTLSKFGQMASLNRAIYNISDLCSSVQIATKKGQTIRSCREMWRCTLFSTDAMVISSTLPVTGA